MAAIVSEHTHESDSCSATRPGAVPRRAAAFTMEEATMAANVHVLSALRASSSYGSARLVLATLGLLADDAGTVHLDEYTIAELAALPPLAVSRAMLSLEQCGDISVQPIPGAAWRVQLLRGTWPQPAPTNGHAPPGAITFHDEVIVPAGS